jgi:hypothetical protein
MCYQLTKQNTTVDMEVDVGVSWADRPAIDEV